MKLTLEEVLENKSVIPPESSSSSPLKPVKEFHFWKWAIAASIILLLFITCIIGLSKSRATKRKFDDSYYSEVEAETDEI